MTRQRDWTAASSTVHTEHTALIARRESSDAIPALLLLAVLALVQSLRAPLVASLNFVDAEAAHLRECRIVVGANCADLDLHRRVIG